MSSLMAAENLYGRVEWLDQRLMTTLGLNRVSPLILEIRHDGGPAV